MSFLNNTDEGNSSTNQMLLFMVLAFGGFALYAQFFGPQPDTQAKQDTEQVEQAQAAQDSKAAAGDQAAKAGSGAGAGDDQTPPTTHAEGAVAGAPSDANTPANDVQPTEAEIVAPFRLHASAEEGAATFYVTNVGGRVASVSIDGPKQYLSNPGGERFPEIFPDVFRCEDGTCTTTGDIQDAQLPLSLDIPGLSALSETTVWEVNTDKSDCTEADGVQSCSRLVLNWNTPDGSLSFTRTYTPASHSPFGLATTLQIHNNTATARTIQDVGIRTYGNWSAPTGGMFNRVDSRTDGMCGTDGKFKSKTAKKLDEPKSFSEKVQYAGLNERYFVSAVLPRTADGKPTTADRCVYKQADKNADNTVQSTLYQGSFTISGESGRTFAYDYVAAPKRIGYLKDFDANLEKSVKFGMFSFIAYGIRWLLVFFQSFVGNWGVAILLLTVFIKLILLPITTKSYRSMEKMKKVQPKIDELKKKYENDQQKLAEAQMHLFKEEGVNPLSGCLPLVLQMPIYFALYRTIFSSAELYRAPFLGWITDLSQADPYFILPVITSIFMIAQVKFTPQAGNPSGQMKIMQWMMPIMFVPVTLFLPAGLVLYMLVNMGLTLVQQIYIHRTIGGTSKKKAA